MKIIHVDMTMHRCPEMIKESTKLQISGFEDYSGEGFNLKAAEFKFLDRFIYEVLKHTQLVI